MQRDMPAIASSQYAATTIPLAAIGALGRHAGLAEAGTWQRQIQGNAHHQRDDIAEKLALLHAASATPNTTATKEKAMSATRRLVQVVIVDPNENIPLDQCLLHMGEKKLTDATDQELFFEIDIKDILAKHNERRVKVVDKKVKERTEYLEPAKIRDLKMVVVNIASF